jgi:hypothetical protein
MQIVIVVTLIWISVSRLPAPISELETPTPTPAPPQSSSAKLSPRIPPISPEVAARIETRFSSWLQKNQFLSFFYDQQGVFHILIEGRLHDGAREYRAIFDKTPTQDFHFFFFFGQQRSRYEEVNNRLTSQGYKILSQQTFQDEAGEPIYQTVWVRNDQMPAARECLQRIVH